MQCDFFVNFSFNSTPETKIISNLKFNKIEEIKFWFDGLNDDSKFNLILYEIFRWRQLMNVDNFTSIKVIKNYCLLNLNDKVLFYTKGRINNIYFYKNFFWKSCFNCNKTLKNEFNLNCNFCQMKINNFKISYCFQIQLKDQKEQINCSILGKIFYL